MKLSKPYLPQNLPRILFYVLPHLVSQCSFLWTWGIRKNRSLAERKLDRKSAAFLEVLFPDWPGLRRWPPSFCAYLFNYCSAYNAYFCITLWLYCLKVFTSVKGFPILHCYYPKEMFSLLSVTLGTEQWKCFRKEEIWETGLSSLHFTNFSVATPGNGVYPCDRNSRKKKKKTWKASKEGLWEQTGRTKALGGSTRAPATSISLGDPHYLQMLSSSL